MTTGTCQSQCYGQYTPGTYPDRCTCTDNTECASGFCLANGLCGSTCENSGQSIGSFDLGCYCSYNDECSSGTCSSNLCMSPCNITMPGQLFPDMCPCSGASECASNTCVNNTCTSDCASLTSGSPFLNDCYCTYNSECVSAFCSSSNKCESPCS
jgi:hypothetical protein